MSITIDQYDSNDELHRTLLEMNAHHGRGEMAGLAIKYTHHGFCYGFVICELQHGIEAFKFTVNTFDDMFRVCYRGYQRTVKSDYFKDSP